MKTNKALLAMSLAAMAVVGLLAMSACEKTTPTEEKQATSVPPSDSAPQVDTIPSYDTVPHAPAWCPWYEYISIDTLPELPNSEWWGTLSAHEPHEYMLANVVVGDSICRLFHNAGGGPGKENYVSMLHFYVRNDTIFETAGSDYSMRYRISHVSAEGDSVAVYLFDFPTRSNFRPFAEFVRVQTE